MNTIEAYPVDPFEIFWNAGMRKVNKKKARQLFDRLTKRMQNPTEFACRLEQDIQERLRRNQFGFESLHPTTYLNGERWEDELPVVRNTQEMSLEQSLNDRSWADGFLNG